MDRLRGVASCLMAWLRREQTKVELDEEMAFHLDMATTENIRSGMSPREARRRAMLEFGSRDWHSERVREERGGSLIEDLLRDFRFGFRVLRKRPIFALAAILTLSVGVGMTTTMFTLVDAVVLRPLPGANAEGMVYFFLETADGSGETSPTPEFLRLLRDHSNSFSQVEAYTVRDYSLSVEGEPLRVEGAMASSGFFSFLGVRPQIGRTFLPQNGTGSGNPIVVLSHTFWLERFGESRDVLGKVVTINGHAHEIIGVLPRDFRVDLLREPRFWVPEGNARQLLIESEPVEGALGRLSPGVTREVAQAELDAIVRNNPVTRRWDRDWVGKVRTPHELVDPSLRRALLFLQGGAVLVFLIACGNLTNLLLAQGEARARELAVRSSLGAGRGRLVRQLMAESAVMGALGGGGGVLLTRWALDSLPFFLPPGYAGFSLNRGVLLLAVGISLLAVLITGLLPALAGSRRNLAEVIKGAPHRGTGIHKYYGTRQVLVVAEVAMAFMLLASAGLLLKNFSKLMQGDVGFPREDLLTVRVELPEEDYGEPELRTGFYEGLRDGLRAQLPRELGMATVANGLVENLSAVIGPIVPEGVSADDREPHPILTWKVAPNFFRVLGLPLSQGRAFLEEDASGEEPVVIINEEIARRHFPSGRAVGRRLQVYRSWHRVVGVSASIELPALQGRFGETQVFLPMGASVDDGFTIIARTEGDRISAVDRIRQVVWSLDRSLPIMEVSLMEDALAESLSEERSNALLMVIFSLTALSLGAVGIYGVVAYSVSRRIQEMGIRLALGASSRGLVGRVVLRGMMTVGIGLVLGAAGTFVLGSTLAGLLVGVDPRDPWVFFPVAAVTAVVALTATWFPARRATTSPMDALRTE